MEKRKKQNNIQNRYTVAPRSLIPQVHEMRGKENIEQSIRKTKTKDNQNQHLNSF